MKAATLSGYLYIAYTSFADADTLISVLRPITNSLKTISYDPGIPIHFYGEQLVGVENELLYHWASFKNWLNLTSAAGNAKTGWALK